MNSLVIVLFLSGMVAMIMLRTLHKDIARYNQMDSTVRETFELFFGLLRIVFILFFGKSWKNGFRIFLLKSYPEFTFSNKKWSLRIGIL